MDMNEYLLTCLVQERLATTHAAARLAAMRAEARPPRPVRIVVGHLLVRLGTRLLAGFTQAARAAA